MKRNIIVIGASTGGFEALKRLIGDLPADINAAILIVWHLSPESINVLHHMLNRQNTIKAAPALDREQLAFNRIYTATPDKHLVLEKGSIRVTRGPKENRFRPSVDVLFRSAAIAYGPRVIGVVLSGSLDDGTAGLWTIKQHGGTAIQDPNEAESPSMPANALRNVDIDHVVPMAAMAELLTRLTTEPAAAKKDPDPAYEDRTREEIRIAIQDDRRVDIETYGQWSPLTCPECHGALAALKEGGRVRYRCHTGHAFSVDSLIDALSASIDESLWSAIRGIKENVLLLNQLGNHFVEKQQPALASLFFHKATHAETRMDLVWKAVLGNEQLNADTIRETSGHK
jgi:two-component system, chemotaxis family, protein-glutamate methylesterase/glutaminase